MRTHFLEGRKREERLGEFGNVARHKRALTSWRGGRGRSRLVSLEMWHITNEDSLAGGGEEGGAGSRAWKHRTSKMRTHILEARKMEGWVGELRNVAHHKQGLTCSRGGSR